MSLIFRPVRLAGVAGALVAAVALTGCYVVPIHPHQQQPAPVVHAPPAPVTFTARLYPANDMATGYGMVGATVTNDLNGRGHFNTTIGGELFTGEATRVSGSSRDGLANGAGNRGSYINCRYTMNSATLGTGTCRLNNGAVFSMHVGS